MSNKKKAIGILATGLILLGGEFTMTFGLQGFLIWTGSVLSIIGVVWCLGEFI